MYLTSFIHRNALFNIAERWFCNCPEPGDVRSLTGILICDGFVINETLAALTNRLLDMTCHRPFHQKCIRSKGELRDMICSDDRNAQPRVVELLKAAGTPAVLIVEDNPDNMTTIKAVLRNRYRTLEATDGEEGLRMAEENEPDLILLDMALPKMDGLTVVRHLKDNVKLSSIPVIAMTAQVMKGDRERILDAGCDDYIAKPIDPESFLKTIGEWLKG